MMDLKTIMRSAIIDNIMETCADNKSIFSQIMTLWKEVIDKCVIEPNTSNDGRYILKNGAETFLIYNSIDNIIDVEYLLFTSVCVKKMSLILSYEDSHALIKELMIRYSYPDLPPIGKKVMAYITSLNWSQSSK